MERKFDYDQRQTGCQRNNSPYRLPLSQWPSSLQAEFDAYEQWRTGKLVPGRPWQRQQRPDTFARAVIQFEGYFGYLVNIRGENANSLRLESIHDLERLRSYTIWHADTRTGGPSRFIEKTLGDFAVVARYYMQVDRDILEGMAKLKAELKPDEVRDHRERWVSLLTLEQVGCDEYPDGQPFPNMVYRALAAQRSLIIRLLVRRPLRSRNIREMRLGHNLYRQAEGWIIEFQGDELKVERRGQQKNVYRISFPADLMEPLEEFLKKWRPILNTKNCDYLFLSRQGVPISKGALNEQIQKAVYERTGRGPNVHLVRHIWATEFIEETQNFSVTAAILGDELETVLRHYAHLRTQDAGRHADEFLAGALRPIKRSGNLHE